MRKSTTLMSSLAIAGLAIAGGSAFTGGGVTRTAPDAFVGGTVTQLVTGASLVAVEYQYSDVAQRSITSVKLTFAGARNTETPDIAITSVIHGDYLCEAVGATLPNESTCSAFPIGTEAVDMSSLAVTLADETRP